MCAILSFAKHQKQLGHLIPFKTNGIPVPTPSEMIVLQIDLTDRSSKTDSCRAGTAGTIILPQGKREDKSSVCNVSADPRLGLD